MMAKLDVPSQFLEQISEKIVRAQLSPQQLRSMRCLDNIVSIEDPPRYKSFNNIAGQIIRPVISKNQQTMTNLAQYEGAEQVIAIADEGLDIGNSDPTVLHDAFKGRLIEPVEVVGRKASDTFGNVAGAWNDPKSHGTHVCATALGNFIARVPDETNQYTVIPFFQGMAPKSKLYFQACGKYAADGWGIDKLVNVRNLYENSYASPTNARIHSCSWGNYQYGADQERPYSKNARSSDEVAREKPDLLMIRAAGNGGDDKEGAGYAASIADFAAARNGITVGASDTSRQRKEVYDLSYSMLGTVKGSQNNVSMTSCRGPTAQGCIKPDLVAPGMLIASAGNQDVKGKKDKDGTWPTVFFSGTSHATPVVAGAAACLREALISAGTASPSSALIKAIFINTATDLSTEKGFLLKGAPDTPAPVVPSGGGSTPSTGTGSSGTTGGNPAAPVEDSKKSGNPQKPLDAVPNGVQGWGRLNLNLALSIVQDKSSLWHFYIDCSDPLTMEKDGNKKFIRNSCAYKVVIPGQRQGFQYNLLAHLVYTDIPGDELQNQLKLTLYDAKKNRIKGSASKLTDKTNVKYLDYRQGLSQGDYFIVVSATDLKPYHIKEYSERQDFALVVRVIKAKVTQGSPATNPIKP